MNYPYQELNSGYKMPLLGLGTFKCAPKDTYNIVREAIKIGYRQFDTAAIYCNEREVGQAINDSIKEGLITREDVFVTTKLWFAYCHPGEVEKACLQSLKNLNLGYIDLYLIHNPFIWGFDEEMMKNKTEEQKYNPTELQGIPFKVIATYDAAVIANAYKEMEALVEKGYVRSIGISNFTVKKTEELLKTAKIMPATNQIEFNVPNQDPSVVAYCLSKGITITAYGQFGRPVGSDPTKVIPLTEPKIAVIGKKYNKTNAQIIIRWLIQRKIFAIPKTIHLDRLRENFDVLDFELSEEDMKYMNDLNNNDRAFLHEFFCVGDQKWQDVWDNEDCEWLRPEF